MKNRFLVCRESAKEKLTHIEPHPVRSTHGTVGAVCELTFHGTLHGDTRKNTTSTSEEVGRASATETRAGYSPRD